MILWFCSAITFFSFSCVAGRGSCQPQDAQIESERFPKKWSDFRGRLHHGGQSHRSFARRKEKFSAAERIPEKRQYQKRGNISERAQKSPGILGQSCQGAALVQAMEKSPPVELAVGQVVYRREAQRVVQLPGSSRQRRAKKQGGDHLGRRARRRACADLSRRLARSQQVRQRAQETRQRKATGSVSTWVWFPSW
jgi:hypothetical protein